MDVVFPFRTVLLLAKSRIGKPGIRKNAKKSKKIEIDDVQKALEDITQYVLEENATERLKSPFGIAGLELDMSRMNSAQNFYRLGEVSDVDALTGNTD